MTGTNTKVRSIFLTVLMVLSVFAGTVALAGTAAAANNVAHDVSDNAEETTGVSYTHSANVTGFTLQHIEINFDSDGSLAGDAGNPDHDLGAVTESDISVYVNGVEYTDGYTGLTTSGATLEVELQNSVTINNDDNVTVVVGDVENPSVGSNTGYTQYTSLRDTSDTEVEGFTSTYTINDVTAGGGGTTAPTLREQSDDTFDTGQNRWAGQLLFFEGATSPANQTYELYEVDRVSGTPAQGDFVSEIVLNSDGRSLIDTSGLQGEYALRDETDNWVNSGTDGIEDSASDGTIDEAEILAVRNQDFSASFSDNTLAQGSTANVEFDSNRGSYNVTVSASDLSNSQVARIFTDEDPDTDGVQVTVTGDETVSGDVPADFSTGNYTFDFEVADTDEADSDYLDISAADDKAASFGQAVYSEERGDNASFTVNLDGGASDALVQVGGPDVNYNVTLRVSDGDGDGQVTVSWNTWRAGRNTNENVAYEATSEDDTVSNVQRYTNRIPQDSRVSAADYDLAVFVDGDEQDVGVITLNQRSTDAATQYVAPEGAAPSNATELAEASTEASETANGDWAVTRFDVSGIYGYVLNEKTDFQSGDDDGVSVTVEEAGDTINTEPKQIAIDQSAVTFYSDDDANQVYMAIDTADAEAERGVQSGLSLQNGETYNVTFTIDGDENPYVAAGSTEEVTTQFTVVEPTATFDTAADGNVTVESAAAQQITGTTNIAPGSSITVRARSTGDSPFLKSNTTTVAEDGTFTSTFDFQNVSQDTQFTVTIPNNDFEDDAATSGIVAPAPTASVSISDQSSDGTTVTVDSASLSDGGFVTIHDGSLLDGDTFESVRGTSAYLESGSHSDITVSLDEPYTEDGTVIAMPHLDTNGNEAYDFVSSDGAEDGPYTDDQGNITLDSASLTISTPEPSPTPTDEPTPTPTDEPTPTPTDEPTPTPSPTDGGGPGFGLAAALIALAGAALLALRRD